MNAETTGITDNKGITELPVGEILRRTRMHYGQSIADVEAHTRIRANQVQALEEGDVEQLPARVYAIGFVRSYAEHLGLDGDHMVRLFKEQAIEKVPEVETYNAATAEDTSSPPIWLIATSVVFVLIVAAMWSGSWTKQRETVEIVPAVPKEIQENAFGGPPKTEETAAQEGTQTAEATDAQTPDTPEIAEPAIPTQKGIILNIRKNSWVEIRDRAGKRLISRVLKAGDQYFVPDRPDLSMSVCNAAGVEVQIDGITMRPLGADAQVKRRIPLDAAFLKLQYAPN
jgi:cytoskeleton protein RodZ